MIVKVEHWGPDGTLKRIVPGDPGESLAGLRLRLENTAPHEWFFAHHYENQWETLWLLKGARPMVRMEHEFRYPPPPGKLHQHARLFQRLARDYLALQRAMENDPRPGSPASPALPAAGLRSSV